jgi:hypothetical protein
MLLLFSDLDVKVQESNPIEVTCFEDCLPISFIHYWIWNILHWISDILFFNNQYPISTIQKAHFLVPYSLFDISYFFFLGRTIPFLKPS